MTNMDGRDSHVSRAEHSKVLRRIDELEKVVGELMTVLSDVEIKEVARALGDLSRIVYGDEDLEVKPLRNLYSDLDTRLAAIEKQIGRAAWLIGAVGSIAGLSAVEVVWKFLTWLIHNMAQAP